MTTYTITKMQQTIEAQGRIINSLQNENHWFQEVIFNPSFNELDMRLLVETTPREVRMGLISIQDAPEKKIYYPDLAAKAHCSDKIASQHVRKLATQAGVFSYRRAYDYAEEGHPSENPRVRVKPTNLAQTPPQTDLSRAKRGGSTWKDGKRVKRCPECNSPVLQKRTQYWCQNPDCQHCWEGPWEPVNNLDDLVDEDEEVNSQYDGLVDDPPVDSQPPGEDTQAQEPEAPPSTDPCVHSIVGSFETLPPPTYL